MVRHLSSPPVNPLYVVSVGDRIPLIPAFKTSAAFLTSLSAHLRIPDDDLYPTPIPTPQIRCSSPLYLPPPSPYAMSVPQQSPDTTISVTDPLAPTPSPLEGVPSLTSFRASTQEDRIAGLKLIADSVAQQRQTASSAVIYHPAVLGLYGIAVGLVFQHFFRSASDLPIIMTTVMGVTMAALLTVRWFTGEYIALAEKIGWDWLGEDVLLVTRWGEEIIGAVVVGFAESESVANGSGRKSKKKNGRRFGLVRGWCVTVRYRGKGVGKALLEDAVQEVVRQGGEGIEFAEEHATYNRVLPAFFNTGMDKGEQRAVDTLHDIARTKGNFGRKRSSS